MKTRGAKQNGNSRKVVQLIGGLGNQMFQYAFAKNLAQLPDTAVALDASAYQYTGSDPVRQLRLNQFSTALPLAGAEELKQVHPLTWRYHTDSTARRIAARIEKKLARGALYYYGREYQDPQAIAGYRYYSGYWQSWRYLENVRSALMRDFTPGRPVSSKTAAVMRKMKAENAVFVGIRRGDYHASERSRTLYGELTEAYYLAAMKYISTRRENPVFYVFSDDISWVKANFRFGTSQVVYRTREEIVSDFEELVLMSSCRDAVISNSTFNFWGAWLIPDPEKIVICPEQWFSNGEFSDILPPDWIRMPGFLRSF